jgi:hypothetical protein
MFTALSDLLNAVAILFAGIAGCGVWCFLGHADRARDLWLDMADEIGRAACGSEEDW